MGELTYFMKLVVRGSLFYIRSYPIDDLNTLGAIEETACLVLHTILLHQSYLKLKPNVIHIPRFYECGYTTGKSNRPTVRP